MIDEPEIRRRFAEATSERAEYPHTVDAVRDLLEWLIAEADEEAKEVSCGCMGSSPLNNLVRIVAALE